MNDDRHKQAGVRDFVGRRMRNVAGELDEAGSGFRAGVMRRQADRVENPKLLRALGEAAKGTGSVVGRAIAPGQSEFAKKHVGKLLSPLGLVLMTTAAALPLGAFNAFKENRVLGPWSEAQMRGEVPMTDPFQTFVQRRKTKTGSAQEEKTANIFRGAGRAAGMGLEGLKELVEKMVTRPGTAEDITDLVTHAAGASNPKNLREFVSNFALKNPGVKVTGADGALKVLRETGRQFSPGRAMGVAAGALGLESLLDVVGGDRGAGGTMQYQVQKSLFPVHERVRAADEAVKAFANQAGKNTADMINDLFTQAATGAAEAAQNVGLSFSQEAKFQQAIQKDPVLREADQQDLEMLRRAFKSMVRFAPQVATDEFAVSNFLREAMLAANGPDYATLGNLARVNRSLTGEKR